MSQIPRWPDCLEGELTIDGKTAPLVAFTKHYGNGAWPGSPPALEFRQVMLVFHRGDARAYRYTLQGIPLDDRGVVQSRHPKLLLGQGRIALQIHCARIRWGDTDPAFYEEIFFEGDDKPTRKFDRDDGRVVTKKQRQRLTRGIALLPQIFKRGQFSFRGAPEGNANRRRYAKDNPKAFHEDLNIAIRGAIAELQGRADISPVVLPDKVGVATVARHWPSGVDRHVLGELLETFGIDLLQAVHIRLRRASELKSPRPIGATGRKE